MVFTLFSAFSAPSTMKESEYLPGCRKVCENDMHTAGMAHFQALRKCNCYCKSVWLKLTDTEINYFIKNNIQPPSLIEKRRISFEACFK